MDNFEPDIMYPDKENEGEYYKVRMVPATQVQYYFSIGGISRFRVDENCIDANPKNDHKLRMIEEKGESIPWKLNINICGPQIRFQIDYDLLKELNCLPRPKKYTPKKDKVKKGKPKWNISKSVFSKFKQEGIKTIEK